MNNTVRCVGQAIRLCLLGSAFAGAPWAIPAYAQQSRLAYQDFAYSACEPVGHAVTEAALQRDWGLTEKAARAAVEEAWSGPEGAKGASTWSGLVRWLYGKAAGQNAQFVGLGTMNQCVDQLTRFNMPLHNPMTSEVADRQNRMLALMRAMTPEREFVADEQERVLRMEQSLSGTPPLPGEAEDVRPRRMEQLVMKSLQLDQPPPVEPLPSERDKDHLALWEANLQRMTGRLVPLMPKRPHEDDAGHARRIEELAKIALTQ